jgi:DNA mismatch repair ATPase MutS
LEGREGVMKLITGPNFSGKSVYLKQVALLTYMAHIGCFVPCEAARIGLTTKILTRIQSPESVATGKSSFLIDLQQIKNMLNASDERTLLIIDEFGKGTNQFGESNSLKHSSVVIITEYCCSFIVSLLSSLMFRWCRSSLRYHRMDFETKKRTLS